MKHYSNCSRVWYKVLNLTETRTHELSLELPSFDKLLRADQDKLKEDLNNYYNTVIDSGYEVCDNAYALAAYFGDWDKITKFHQKEKNVEEFDIFKILNGKKSWTLGMNTIWHYLALGSGDIGLLRKAIEANHEMDHATDMCGDTIFHCLAYGGNHTELLQLLQDYPKALYFKNKAGYAPGAAAVFGKALMFEKLKKRDEDTSAEVPATAVRCKP